MKIHYPKLAHGGLLLVFFSVCSVAYSQIPGFLCPDGYEYWYTEGTESVWRCQDQLDQDTACEVDCCTGAGPGTGGGGGSSAGGPPGSSGLGRALLNFFKGTGGGGSQSQTASGGCCGAASGPPSDCCEDSGGSLPKAMAYWLVTEPVPNLWIKDRPFWYQPSQGKEMALEVTYKGTLGINNQVDLGYTNLFSLGTNCFSPWRAYIQRYEGYSGEVEKFMVITGDGSARHHRLGVQNRESMATLAGEDGSYTLSLRDGSQKIFETAVTLGTEQFYFLSREITPQGFTTSFEYLVTNNVVKLTKIIDADDQEITFTYTNAGPYGALISRIIGPNQLTNTFSYDSSGRLTHITDIGGLTSEFRYDSSNRVEQLLTPYGTNTFQYLLATDGSWQGLRVIEKDERHHLFLYGTGPANVLSDAESDFPDLHAYLSGAGFLHTVLGTNLNERNSYYWGPRQYDNLATNVLAALENETFSLADLSLADYRKGRTRQWLVAPYQSGSKPSRSLNLERQPSPDPSGASGGLIVWYDYKDKKGAEPFYEAPSELPRYKAWKVGVVTNAWDETLETVWRVIAYERNSLGKPLKRIENYGLLLPSNLGVPTQWRTNRYTYVDDLFRAGEYETMTPVQGGATQEFMVKSNAYGSSYRLASSSVALDEATMQTTAYGYDNAGRVTSVQQPNGLVTTNIFNANGRLEYSIDRFGSTNLRTNSYTWSADKMASHTDPRGLTTYYLYDKLGRQTVAYYADGTGTTNVYERLDLVQTTDRMGFTNRFEYNAHGQVLRAMNARGHTNTFVYCTCGELEDTIDPLGNRTSYTYDNLGRRTQIIYPDLSWTAYRYDLLGQVTNMLDSSGVSLTNIYNIQGLPVKQETAFGRNFFNSYDDHDHVITNYDANAVLTTSKYDWLGRVLSRTVGETATEYFGYATNQMALMAYTNPVSEVTLYSYDPLGRKTNETFLLAATNRFRYAPAGDLLTLTDANNQTTSWQYDSFGRVTNKLDANGASMFRYSYDLNGRLTNRWTPAKGNTGYAYDRGGNLTNVDYAADADLRFEYDAAQRLTGMSNAVGRTTFTYTSFGALLSEDGPWENDTVAYQHDNRRRSRVSLAQPNASPWVQSYTYDALGRIKAVTSPAGVFEYGYLPGDFWEDTTWGTMLLPTPGTVLEKLNLPGGAAIDYTHDALARLTATWLRNSTNATLNGHEYWHDAANRRVLQLRWTQAASLAHNSVSYTYDKLGQLESATGTDGNGWPRYQDNFGYAYDAAGNLRYRTNNSSLQTFNVNNLNQLTTQTRNGVITVAGSTTGGATNVMVNDWGTEIYSDGTFATEGYPANDGTNILTAVAQDSYNRWATNSVTVYLPASVSFTYDQNGNLLFDGRRHFSYDDENQLISVSVSNQWQSWFAYDGKMRRRVRTEATWNGSGWTTNAIVRYIYDGNLVLQERHYSPAQMVPPQQVVTYTRGKDLSGGLQGAGGIGGLLARTEGLASILSHAYYHADGNGNVTMLINAQQQPVARYLYDPFGNTLAASGPLAEANLYRFSSKEAHAESVLVYYLYRYYEPELQRWINRDPIGERGALNLFGFVRNSPISYLDAYGLIGVVRPNPKVNDPNSATIQCKGGKYDVVLNWAKGKPYESCVRAHEEQHIQDWKKRYGENSCQGVPDGSLPMDGGGYEAFRHDSECKAHAVARDCAKKLCKSEKNPKANAADQGYAQSENNYLGANHCPQYDPNFTIFQ